MSTLSDEERRFLRLLNDDVSTDDLVTMLLHLTDYLERDGKAACAKVAAVAARRLQVRPRSRLQIH